MPRKPKTVKASPPPRVMKMKELSEATGVNSATIRYYINQGLLPQPHKTHKNMAYYDERYIALVNLVKKLQKEYFLPLDVIKQAIEEVGHERAPYMIQEIVEKLVQEKEGTWSEVAPPNHEAGMTRAELVAASGLSTEDFDAAVEAGFLLKDGNDRFDRENIQVAMLLAQIRSHLTREKGFSTEFFIMHFKTLETLVNKELSLFMNNIQSGNLSIEEVNQYANRSFDLFHKISPILHKRLISKKIKDSLNL
ncbi:MerR family transcriptional regulator [Desulfosudis oleivorans]|uniref:Transcriptional regulator, MerR family n=1 Tax=Desulfosudis oleivorans (strain DSM 6200 / JCM 39069 / Hxd3) TaxID=96561 RepID=A8ZST3_DESOH|nr:MerR family transcriptional regulator [Desulfosudis oleivorans]ABW65996.1 transcriptional regulator, MerR family [Desulfosudis oleivorans Hxd3]